MEIYFKTDTRNLRLPILPPEITVNGGTVETSINLLGIGEVSIFGGKKLQEVEISCFFPSLKNSQSYSFLQVKSKVDPYYYVAQFKWWLKYNQVIQLIVTPSLLSIPVRVVSFEYGEKDGTRDVYYTVKLKEVAEIKVNKLNNTSSNASANIQRPPSQTQEKASSTQKTHTVKHGESLWLIAQKHYGNGSQYPKIKNANINKYPSLKQNNIIYSNWILVIP